MERKAGVLASLLAEEFGLDETRVRRIVDSDNGRWRALLMSLSEPVPEWSAFMKLPEVLKAHGLSVDGLPSRLPNELTDLGRLLAQHLAEWLEKNGDDFQQTALLSRALSGVFARRIMKDAIAAYHPVLAEIVRCVDLGVQVNIKSNAKMAQTDTRRYELGNFLLIAGVNSDEVRGWVPGPLRLRVGQTQHSSTVRSIA